MVGARGRVGAGRGQECEARGTKGWAVEGRPSAVTRRYASGARGRIRAAWGHGHGVRGDPLWAVGRGTRMGRGRSLVWVSGTQSRRSRARRRHPSTRRHTPRRAVEHDGVRGKRQGGVGGTGEKVSENNRTFDRRFISA